MSYACEWDGCSFTSDKFDIFYDHVLEHTATNFRDPDDLNEIECQWSQCFADSYEDDLEYRRHVLFHAYHAKLKNLGLEAQRNAGLAPCILDPQARNLVPDFPEQFYCHWENCEVVTSCPRYYYTHMDGHAQSTVKDDSNGLVSCRWKDCSFTSPKRFKLKEHCRTHTHEKCFGCPNCGGLFSNKTKFTDHLRRQNTMESESYQCSHCLKYCASERILRDHMRHHINNVKCSYCEMTCPTQSALQHHINFRHSDSKPFSCEMCENSFKSMNDLRRHQQTHNPIYSYACQEEGCDYASKALQSLKRHIKLWHENSTAADAGQYECHICRLRYSRGSTLTRHLKKQHTFRWPAGHKRFRYKEDHDGIYRLQTVRFESVELSQQLEAARKKQQIGEENGTEDDSETAEGSNDRVIARNVSSQENEEQIQITRTPSFSSQPETLPQPESNIMSSVPTQQTDSFLEVLSQLQQHSQQGTPYCSTINNADISSNVPISNVAQSPSEPQIQLTALRDNFDVQEAVSLLAMLKNSGVTYKY